MPQLLTSRQDDTRRLVNDAHYAVVVGINFYQHLQDLGGPVNDAAQFCEWLVDEDGGGLPAENVRPVKATEERDGEDLIPTLGDIHQTLNYVNLEMNARLDRDPGVFERSRLYVFVAGHGMSAPKTSVALFSTEAVQGMWGKALDVQACGQWYVDYGPFAEVVLLADCCRTRYHDVSVEDVPFDKSTTKRGRPRPVLVTGFATLPDELAFEAAAAIAPDEKRGYFSQALLDAVREEIDPDSGYVTSLSLAKGIRTRVEAMTAPPCPAPQTSQMQGPLETPVIFGPRRDHLRPVTIRVSAEKARRYGTLELLTGDSKFVARCPVERAGSTWRLDLRPGLYRLRWVNTDGTVRKGPNVDTDEPSEDVDA